MRKRLFLLLTSLLMVSACGDDAPKAPQAPTVSAIKAKNTEISYSLPFSGFAKAIEQVDIKARVSGYLGSKPFKPGSQVKKGDVLFTIEKETFEAALSAAKADLFSAKQQYKRAQDLIKTGAISQSAFDNYKATYLKAEAALKNAELNMSYSRITAPIAGTISDTALNVGDAIGPESGTLTTIVNQKQIKVEFGIPPTQINEVMSFSKNKDISTIKVSATFENSKPFSQPGKLTFVDGFVDNSTGTIKAKVEFANPNKELIPGQFLNIKLESATPQNRITLPQASVLVGEQGQYVFSIVEGKVTPIPVTVNTILFNNRYVIESGLSEGDLVIVDGLTKIRPGMNVNSNVRE